jgi:hypothetical protein
VLKNIYYYGVGSLHNNESSVDGGKYIRLPFMTELCKKGYDVSWVGFDRDGQFNNKYLDLIGLHKNDYMIDLRRNMVHKQNVMNADQTKVSVNVDLLIETSPGALFVELRPMLDKPGYNFMNEWNVQLELIDKFYDAGLPVFVWDQDVWAQHFPDEHRHKFVLLRSYFEEVEGFPNQELFLYGWYDVPFDKKLIELSKNKKFDASYCGNVYGRRDEFLEYFSPFEKNELSVCVQGNWLRKKYDDRDFALDNFPHFMFFGRTPHWSTLPTVAMSKSVIQFSNAAQQAVGLPTARIFETLMGRSVVFCTDKIKHIDRVAPEELIVTSGDDLIEKWLKYDRDDEWASLRSKFERKLMIPEHSYANRVMQLEDYTRKYYE